MARLSKIYTLKVNLYEKIGTLKTNENIKKILEKHGNMYNVSAIEKQLENLNNSDKEEFLRSKIKALNLLKKFNLEQFKLKLERNIENNFNNRDDIQNKKNKRLLKSTKKIRNKKTKKLILKRGVGRSIKNRLVNSVFFSKGRRLIKKKRISETTITNNDIKSQYDDVKYIFIDYDNLVKYLGKYTDFYFFLNNLVYNLKKDKRKVILITIKKIVKSYDTTELFNAPSFTYDSDESTQSSINKCMLISIAGSVEEEMNLQNFKNKLIDKNIINKNTIPSAISINNLSGLKILHNIITKMETSKPEFIIEFGDDRLSRQQKYSKKDEKGEMETIETFSLKQYGEVNHSEYKKGVNVVLFEVKDMNKGNPFEKKVLSKNMLVNNLEYVSMGKERIRKGFTTKSNNLQYSLAFYLSLEEYKNYLLPNIDTNYNGIINYNGNVNYQTHLRTMKAYQNARELSKKVGSNNTQSNSTKFARKKPRTTNGTKFIEGTKKPKNASEVIKYPKERVVNNQLEELNLTQPVYLNNNFSEPLYGRSNKSSDNNSSDNYNYNLYTSNNKQGKPEYTGIKRDRLQKFNLNKAIIATINNRYKSSASSIIEQLTREAINTIKQRIQQDRLTNARIQNIKTDSVLNEYINKLINNNVRLRNIHLPKK